MLATHDWQRMLAVRTLRSVRTRLAAFAMLAVVFGAAAGVGIVVPTVHEDELSEEHAPHEDTR